MQINHNNHYVPQAYLQGWGIDNKIFVYRLLVSHNNVPLWNRQAIAHTASQNNLYTRLINNREYDDIETEFNVRFESPAKGPLEKARNGDGMSVKDWEILIDFMAAQHVRTLAFHQKIQPNFKNIAAYSVNNLASGVTSADEFIDKLKTQNSSLAAPTAITSVQRHNGCIMVAVESITGKNTWLFEMNRMLEDHSDFRTTLHKYKWSIVTSHKNVEWPTSDTPLAIVNLYAENCYLASLGQPENRLIFPISPSKALVTIPSSKLQPRFEFGLQESMLIKNIIVRNGYMFVYSRSQDGSIPKMRKRTVDKSEYDRIHNMYQEWYNSYAKFEGFTQ